MRVCAGTAPHDDNAVVVSKPDQKYIRAKLPDGSFQPETYSFGEGGYFDGPTRDDSFDTLKFLDVARVLAGPLAGQNYVPSSDPKKTKLLLMIYWGVTSLPPGGDGTPALKALREAEISFADAIDGHKLDRDDYEDRLVSTLVMVTMEDKPGNGTDFTNGPPLGFDSAALFGTGSSNWTTLGARQHDVITAAEDHRYFIVLMAYDFQAMWKQRKHKLLWATSFSLRQHNHNFIKDLPTMAEYASTFFGQDSHGLLRKGMPQGLVNIGPIKSLGEAPQN
jgi:hypothetical protein